YFFPRTGRVLVKKIRGLNNNTLANREQDYAHQLQAAQVAGAVELFD
ncbi:MAG: chemoreceptor glutamine deamidase CheD, partial [Burkholderiaceae bacterium]